ncbi:MULTISPECIES: RDD family protein [Prauserella salsuginis group]|uniref:RDD family protein n=2 Tax=Prauserella salsuginis group TaxID=2893672 RepID=A0ABW6G7X4_9PSEU|nr:MULTISPECIES: RDD family protein [Prauserella salsuginis group]MBB3661756.1 putative RDD family membrane protein YckC [Prauserella sediminis]MCR3719667.1 RDD family protein [Prauserella flava]MCR3735320.1 RDD family protein [Prauserella salsuginis]
MARWTGDWLANLSAAADQDPPRWPGERLGLPADGVGAVAGSGRRLLGLIADLLLASLLTALFLRPDVDDMAVMESFNLWSLGTWALITVVSAAWFSFTPGMGLCGIRVGRLDGGGVPGLWRALVRCVLTFLIIPAAVRNTDARGWHDRLTGTVVVRMR